MKKIELNSWERKSHFEWFSTFADPTFALDVKINITNVINACKEREISSFATLMYIFASSINNNYGFRLRVLNGEVYEIEKANVAYTVMVNDNTFVNCRASMKNGFDAFIEEVMHNQKKFQNSNYIQKQYNDTAIVDDIYCSCAPWVNFLSVRQPIPDKSEESKSIPRVCWGKYYTEGNMTYTTLNITANHALVDGIDIARVFNEIQNRIDEF